MEITSQLDRETVLYAAAGGTVLLVLSKLYATWASPLSTVPGPWYAPWTDLVTTYVGVKGERHLHVLRLHEKYGPVVRLSPNEISVRGASGASTIHQVKRPFLKSGFYKTFIPGVENIFNTIDPEFHRRHRRLLSAPLSESQLQTIYLPRIEAHFDLAISKMRADINTKGYTDIAKWFLFLTTDVIGELSFGDSFHMLESGEVNQYILDLQGDKLTKALAFALGDITSLKIAQFLPGFKQVRERSERNLGFARESIARHKKLVERQEAGEETGTGKLSTPYPTLFQKMYSANDADGETLTTKELVDDAGVYIIAGSDTTSISLTYLIWAVCRRPELHKALIAEIAALPENYTQKDLKDMHLMNLIIQETLRLYSAAPSALPRVVPPEGAEIDGHWIPGGTVVSTTTYAMHRDASVFPNPDEFDPWRWEKPTKEMKNAWMPFGGGTRTCIGMHLAYIEIRLGVVRFFTEFPNAKISTREGMSDEDMEQMVFFLMSPKGKRCLVEA